MAYTLLKSMILMLKTGIRIRSSNILKRWVENSLSLSLPKEIMETSHQQADHCQTERKASKQNSDSMLCTE